MQAPVKAAPHDGGGAVGEGVSADDVNHGAHHGPAILSDGRQQRLQPHLVHLTVTVQEHQHLPCRAQRAKIHSAMERKHAMQCKHLLDKATLGDLHGDYLPQSARV